MAGKICLIKMGKEGYAKKLEYNREHRRNNLELHREYSRRKRLKTKQRCFGLYGSRCNKCGFNDIRALQLDHINSEGGEIRRGDRNHAGDKLYMKILSGKQPVGRFQLLCANCNWIKRFENNECGRIESVKRS